MARKKYKTDFYEKKDKENNQSSKGDNTVQTVTKWNKDTILIAGDSILYGIDEKRLSKNGRVNVRLFPGATVDDMYSYLQPLIDKSPSVLILHVGTNNAPTFNPRQILDKMINLKNHVMERLPNCKVLFSTPVMRTENGKATLTIKKINQILHEEIAVDLVDNNNIKEEHPGRKGLHLNGKGIGRFSDKLYFKNKISIWYSMKVQWNFSNPKFQGTDRFVRIREVFELGKFWFKKTKISKLQISNSE